jgi:hypothetical protein
MAKVSWSVKYNATSITSRVLSMNITTGREKYLDNYAGGQATITIDNSGDYASGLIYGNPIEIESDVEDFLCTFWIQSVIFNDYPGNTGLNTATITAVDWLARSGRVNCNNFVLAQNDTSLQITAFQSSLGGPLPTDMLVSNLSAGSIASAITYTGSVNNYINLLQNTERGYLVVRRNYLYPIPRPYTNSFIPISTTLGRTTSSTQIAYKTFDRIQNGLQFINTATISPNGLADQTSTNTTSVTTYGPAFYSSESVDYTTTQATGNAEWIVNTFSDPYSLRFECSFTDVAQNATALSSFMNDFWGSVNRTVNLSYQVPGGSLTTVAVVMEGAEINVTPESTTFNMTFSPLQYYQFFKLDSSTLGILDTSRLGWRE